MRVPAISLLILAACGAAPAPAPGLADAPAPTAPVELRVRSPAELTRFACTRSVTFPDPSTPPVRAGSELQLRRPIAGDGRWLRHRVYGRVEGASGARLDGLQLRSVIDARNRPLEGPDATSGGGGLTALALVAVERFLEPVYPERPVRVGDDWAEPAFAWGPPPLDASAIEVDRRFTLLAVEGPPGARVARVAWDTTIRVNELSFSGMMVSGRATITGDQTVSLADGVSGSGSLDVSVDIGPSGIPDLLGRVQLEAKIRSRCQPAAASAPRGLVQGLRPTGSLGRLE